MDAYSFSLLQLQGLWWKGLCSMNLWECIFDLVRNKRLSPKQITSCSRSHVGGLWEGVRGGLWKRVEGKKGVGRHAQKDMQGLVGGMVHVWRNGQGATLSPRDDAAHHWVQELAVKIPDCWEVASSCPWMSLMLTDLIMGRHVEFQSCHGSVDSLKWVHFPLQSSTEPH